MYRTLPLAAIPALAAMLLAGCDSPDKIANQTVVTNDAMIVPPDETMLDADNGIDGNTTAITDGWVGRWKGVEGLFLTVAADAAKGPGHYTLTMQWTTDTTDNGAFEGVTQGDAIRFVRSDGVHYLRASNGDATGLKYLAGKRDCLTVAPGEGYCRD